MTHDTTASVTIKKERKQGKVEEQQKKEEPGAKASGSFEVYSDEWTSPSFFIPIIRSRV